MFGHDLIAADGKSLFLDTKYSHLSMTIFNDVDVVEVDRWTEEKEPWIKWLKQREEESNGRRRNEEIQQSRYNKRYKEIRT